MRILIVASVMVRTSDVPLLLKRAFEAIGCTVFFIPTSEDLPFWAEVGYCGWKINNRLYHWSFSKHLFARACDFRPDVVFIYGSNWCVPANIIRQLKRKLGCKVIIWEVNNCFFQHHQAESISLYDHFFVLDSYMIPVLKVAGVEQVQHLCACADPEEHSVARLSEQDCKRYGSDICFVGSYSPERAQLFEVLTDYNLKIYGTGWENANSEISRCINFEPVYGLKKTKIYAGSKVSINFHGQHMIAGENFRVFEVATTGTAVSFSAYKPDLLQCFVPDKEIIIFENKEDLRRKIDYYLQNIDKLNSIAKASQKRILSEHTYIHRVYNILNKIM